MKSNPLSYTICMRCLSGISVEGESPVVLPRRATQGCPHPEPRLFCLLPWHIPYHFHKMGLASGGCGGQTSQDIDMGFLGVTGQGHNPASSCHGVASCSYEPAGRAQGLLRGKHQWGDRGPFIASKLLRGPLFWPEAESLCPISGKNCLSHWVEKQP